MHPIMEKFRRQPKANGSPFAELRFKTVPAAARPHVEAALQLEVKIGWAVRDGKLIEADDWRTQARAAWAAARALGV